MNGKRVKKAIEIEYKSEKQWINSNPLKLDKLTGKVILLDFWAYSCVNCIRTIPSLKKIWEKYKNKRFVIIGIHTPEFEFEKEIGNVKYAVKKHGITWPVLSDPERNNWENYGNQYWPRTAIIDENGNVIFEHVGESGYDEIDKVIGKELEKLREVMHPEVIVEEKRKIPVVLSPETYFGNRRSGRIDGLVCTTDYCDQYVAPEKFEGNKIYLQGLWEQTPEYVEYKGKDGDGWLAFRYYSSEVNVVMSGVGEVEVCLDEFPIVEQDKGKDIMQSSNNSVVKVEGSDMYNIIKHKDYHSRLLKLKPVKVIKIYALTFG